MGGVVCVGWRGTWKDRGGRGHLCLGIDNCKECRISYFYPRENPPPLLASPEMHSFICYLPSFILKVYRKSVNTKILAPTEIFLNKTEYPDEAVIKILSISI